MKYIWLFLLVFTVVSCKKKTESTGTPAKNYSNIAYGTEAKQNFDLYMPAGATASTTPLLILIHGGGWTEGDKSDFIPYISELQKRLPTYAFASINYRLSANGQNIFPTQENDVKAAISFIASKGTEYGYSQTIGLLGASAGAHLALLHAYKYTSPLKVKAVISLFGPTNMTTMYTNPPNILTQPALLILLSGTPATNPTLYQQSSPIQFVSNQASPTLLFHGGNDFVVLPEQSASLKSALTLAGATAEYYFYPAEAHGWVGDNLTDTFNKIEAFAKKYIQ
ncbi:MAG: alpha/beta hydrolase [Chitinophagaceae bacterium]|nr:alpha/beta hydrolase [Chitinophagaceae bacterium]